MDLGFECGVKHLSQFSANSASRCGHWPARRHKNAYFQRVADHSATKCSPLSTLKGVGGVDLLTQ